MPRPKPGHFAFDRMYHTVGSLNVSRSYGGHATFGIFDHHFTPLHPYGQHIATHRLDFLSVLQIGRHHRALHHVIEQNAR